MRPFYFFVLFFFVYGGLMAQPHIQTLHDENGADFLQPSVVAYPDNNYIVTGTLVKANGHSNLVVVKISDSGTVLWSKYMPDERDSFAGSLMIDSDDNIVITGYRGFNNNDFPSKDLRVLKLDGQGNFVDEAIIGDPDFNFGLYGMDLTQTDSGDYLIIGIGTNGATEAADKYGFVLRLQQDFSSMSWGKRYVSTSSTNKYDAFNHILKVNDPHFGGEVYLLTGSGATPSTNKMMVTNDLIDGLGNSLWGGAVGHRYSLDDYINPGRLALYQKTTHDFYVQSYGAENIPTLLRLDSDGNGYDPEHYHNHFWGSKVDNINLVNGMRWATEQQDKIIMSGYHIEPSIPLGQAWPMLINADISGNLQANTNWIKYLSFFDGTDFKNINFDFIVNPLNFSHPLYPYMGNQLYYQPKGMVREVSDENNDVKFVVPNQDPDDSQFNVNFLNLSDLGESADCASIVIKGGGAIPTTPLVALTNFMSYNHSFSLVKDHSTVENANITSTLSCYPDLPKKKTSQEQSKETSIIVYPNPTSRYVYLDNVPEHGNLEINLYNIQGKRVLNKSIRDSYDRVQMDMSNLQSEIYFIEVRHQGKAILMEQIIKK